MELINSNNIDVLSKNVLDDDVKEKKKRGRKPKQKDNDEVKVLKKRGRKPTGKVINYNVSENCVTDKSLCSDLSNEMIHSDDDDCTVLHLPINVNLISNDDQMTEIVKNDVIGNHCDSCIIKDK